MERSAPAWLDGCRLRDIWFQPTFHKHAGQLCNGVQIHAEGPGYDHHAFKPWRVQALAFKAIRTLYPDYPLWRDFPYEYVLDKLAIDVINGGPGLRAWEIGRAHVCTPVTNAQLVCRLLLAKNKIQNKYRK